jgi:transcriptional regulator with PAS, ATPase and Fis domain
MDHKLRAKLVGQSKSIQEIFYNIDVVAQSDATVFIKGDSGTGKELIAEAIHDNSNRADQPFLKINCAAVPETLFESTLFGHEKGSFSGAYKSQKGIFEECDGGTLLLDEISEIPYNMQAKLLRVLQEMRVIRVGSAIEIPIDVRIIATSNRDLHEMIQNGIFREDLFFRLNVFPVTVQPLRNRREDIPVLVDHFLKLFKKKYKYESKILTDEAMQTIMEYNWPGNVRQLEHMIERAILFSGKEEAITLKHLNFEPEMSAETEDIDLKETVPTLAEMEKKLIFAALKKTQDHRTNAADMLGITVRTLRNKLKQYDMAVEEE